MKKITIISSLFIAMSTALSAIAAPQTYLLDADHTFPRFSYSHFGYSTQMSRFNKTTGKVIFDPVAKSGSVEVVIDATSVDTGSTLFNEHIQGEDFLNTARYPVASYTSTKVIFKGKNPARIEGNLTLKGITRPVTLTVTSFKAMEHPMLKREAIGANAFAIVKRSDFNAGKYAPYVGDEVRIDIALEAAVQQ